MGAWNDDAKSWVGDQMVLSHPERAAACEQTELRAAVAREFSLMEQAHDQIRAQELLARLGETTPTD